VRPDGTVKVIDFGLAKAMDPAGASSANAMNSPTLSLHATRAGIVLGTAATDATVPEPRVAVGLVSAQEAGIEPSPFASVCGVHENAHFRGRFERWCGRKDLNLHDLAIASPSSWCVCQFRHFRKWCDQGSGIISAPAPEAAPKGL
jgi:hypothetical protein